MEDAWAQLILKIDKGKNKHLFSFFPWTKFQGHQKLLKLKGFCFVLLLKYQ